MAAVFSIVGMLRKFAPLATWGAPLGLLAGWTAYPALTPAYKHEILPSIFPNPDLK